MKARTTTKAGVLAGTVTVAVGIALLAFGAPAFLAAISLVAGGFAVGYSVAFYLTVRMIQQNQLVPLSPRGDGP